MRLKTRRDLTPKPPLSSSWVLVGVVRLRIAVADFGGGAQLDWLLLHSTSTAVLLNVVVCGRGWTEYGPNLGSFQAAVLLLVVCCANRRNVWLFLEPSPNQH